VRIAISYLLLVLMSAAAQAEDVQRIEIYDVGIYKSQITGHEEAPGTPAGYRNVVTGIELQQRTTTIPATSGTEFGFRYAIIGNPEGAAVNLRMVSHYPSPGLRNPKTGNAIMRGEYSVERKLGDKSWKSYLLEDDWELVPGTWTFEIWQGERKLAEQSFTVMRP